MVVWHNLFAAENLITLKLLWEKILAACNKTKLKYSVKRNLLFNIRRFSTLRLFYAPPFVSIKNEIQYPRNFSWSSLNSKCAFYKAIRYTSSRYSFQRTRILLSHDMEAFNWTWKLESLSLATTTTSSILVRHTFYGSLSLSLDPSRPRAIKARAAVFNTFIITPRAPRSSFRESSLCANWKLILREREREPFFRARENTDANKFYRLKSPLRIYRRAAILSFGRVFSGRRRRTHRVGKKVAALFERPPSVIKTVVNLRRVSYFSDAAAAVGIYLKV